MGRYKLRFTQTRLEEDRDRYEDVSLYPSFYSRSKTVCYYLLRIIPEVLFKYQNNTYGPSDKLYKNMAKSYGSSINNLVIPEFYDISDLRFINYIKP